MKKCERVCMYFYYKNTSYKKYSLKPTTDNMYCII